MKQDKDFHVVIYGSCFLGAKARLCKANGAQSTARKRIQQVPCVASQKFIAETAAPMTPFAAKDAANFAQGGQRFWGADFRLRMLEQNPSYRTRHASQESG